MNLLEYFVLPLISLIVLFLLTKLMGYRQVTELSLYDYIIGITIGSIAAEMVMGSFNDILKPLIGMIVYGVFTWGDSVLTKRYLNFRFFVEGKPVVLFENDKIYLKSLDKAKIDLNELLMNCRMNGYFELNELDKIILETNGKFTFYPKTLARPLKLGDLHQEVQKEFIPTILILQGTIIYENLELIHHNQKWLEQIMKVHGINLQEIVILYVDGQQTIHFYLKNELKRDFI